MSRLVPLLTGTCFLLTAFAAGPRLVLWVAFLGLLGSLALADKTRLGEPANVFDVGLFFVIPGIEEALRVNGTARLTRDQTLLDSMAVDGKPPKLAIVVSVTEAFLHCAKALKRARLWANDYRLERKLLPTLGRMIVEQAKPVGLTVEEADARIATDYRTNLY